ncbi:hypothetical protein [Wolbachia endosymbiont of Pentidionis agamae]|uniref:hypothetical protein n=1 Tax=Wolbachia endosymbiont of Pentidionis agamae TaxID=3110435 RepID=UPI002FCE7EFD
MEPNETNDENKIQERIKNIKCEFDKNKMSKEELNSLNDYLHAIQERLIEHGLIDIANEIVSLHGEISYEITCNDTSDLGTASSNLNDDASTPGTLHDVTSEPINSQKQVNSGF